MAAGPALGKQFVAVPEVEWDVLVPYVRANIVAWLKDDDFQVFVCAEQTDRAVQAPFDEALSDFAKVLTMQALRDEPKVLEGIQTTTEAFRRRVGSLTEDERGRYRELFWEDLSRSPDVLPRLASKFHDARRRGRLRCWSCEKDGQFAPAARRLSKDG